MTTLASIITEDVASENWQNAYGNMVLKITEPRKLVLKGKEKASASSGKNSGAKGGSKGGNGDGGSKGCKGDGGSKGFKGDGGSKAWKDEDDEETWGQHTQKRHKSAAAADIEWCWSEHIEIMEAARIDAEAKKALKQLAKADWEEFIAFMKKFKAKFEAEELRKPNNFVIICVRNALEKLEA